MEIAIHEMTHVKAKIKFLSIEPLLADMGKYDEQPLKELRIYNWVIIGGKSGKDRFYPPEDWIREIESACAEARIPVFKKDSERGVKTLEFLVKLRVADGIYGLSVSSVVIQDGFRSVKLRSQNIVVFAVDAVVSQVAKTIGIGKAVQRKNGLHLGA